MKACGAACLPRRPPFLSSAAHKTLVDESRIAFFSLFHVKWFGGGGGVDESRPQASINE
jgi:hypothetical protein